MKTQNMLTEKEKELVSLLIRDCKTTGDIHAKLKQLFAGTVEQMLEAEMEEHLGYEKHSVVGNNSGNSRNGYNSKTISSDYGETLIHVPRDRNARLNRSLSKNARPARTKSSKKSWQCTAKA